MDFPSTKPTRSLFGNSPVSLSANGHFGNGLQVAAKHFEDPPCGCFHRRPRASRDGTWRIVKIDPCHPRFIHLGHCFWGPENQKTWGAPQNH